MDNKIKWKLVPADATPEMVAAAIDLSRRSNKEIGPATWDNVAPRIYRAMLDAAPSSDDAIAAIADRYGISAGDLKWWLALSA